MLTPLPVDQPILHVADLSKTFGDVTAFWMDALKAFGLNFLWLALGVAAFVWFHGRARGEGRLLHIGE